MNWPQKITKDEFQLLSKEWELAGYVLRGSELSWTPFRDKLLDVYEHVETEDRYSYYLVVEYAVERDEDFQEMLVLKRRPIGPGAMTAKQLGL